jgi:threonyl-tRNA synthetase
MSVYLEHTGGEFPLWLAPVGVKIIPINNDKHLSYASDVYSKLKEIGVQVELDDSKNGLGKKVRDAKDMKLPYWIVIGDAEMDNKTVTLESRSGEKTSLTTDELVAKLKEEIINKK